MFFLENIVLKVKMNLVLISLVNEVMSMIMVISILLLGRYLFVD